MQATLAAVRPAMVFALLGTTRARARHARRQRGRVGYETVDYGLTMLLYAAAAALWLPPAVRVPLGGWSGGGRRQRLPCGAGAGGACAA